MPNKVGQSLGSVGLLTDVDFLPTPPAVSPDGRPFAYRDLPGTWFADDAGNEYIYLLSLTGVLTGSAVTWGLSAVDRNQVILTTTTTRGPVAIAMAPFTVGGPVVQYSWFQTKGIAQALFAAAAVAGAKLYATATPGQVDDAVVASAQIDNAIVAATVAGAGLGAIFLRYGFQNGQG